MRPNKQKEKTCSLGSLTRNRHNLYKIKLPVKAKNSILFLQVNLRKNLNFLLHFVVFKF